MDQLVERLVWRAQHLREDGRGALADLLAEAARKIEGDSGTIHHLLGAVSASSPCVMSCRACGAHVSVGIESPSMRVAETTIAARSLGNQGCTHLAELLVSFGAREESDHG
jgi:hypothetical protein